MLAGPVVQLGQKAALWGQLPHGVRWVSQERRGAWETSCGPQRGGAGCSWVAVLAALFPGPGGLAPKRDDILVSIPERTGGREVLGGLVPCQENSVVR